MNKCDRCGAMVEVTYNSGKFRRTGNERQVVEFVCEDCINEQKEEEA